MEKLIYLSMLTRPKVNYSAHLLTQFIQAPFDMDWQVALLNIPKVHQGKAYYIVGEAVILIAHTTRDFDWAKLFHPHSSH